MSLDVPLGPYPTAKAMATIKKRRPLPQSRDHHQIIRGFGRDRVVIELDNLSWPTVRLTVIDTCEDARTRAVTMLSDKGVDNLIAALQAVRAVRRLRRRQRTERS